MSDQSQSGRAAIPADMIAFNKKVIEEFRANGGQLGGRLAGSKLMLLTTTGTRTAKPRTVVLGFRMSDGRYATIASANGAPADPAWYGNLVADPEVVVEVGAEKFQARARTASPRERTELAGLFDYLPGQQARTQREIPIVVLERI
jgi:deazaflavin-dependent oxidoreductase (nitroreductase family)